MRSIVSIAKGGRPVLARGLCGSTICTNALQGTTRSISSRNSRLRVFFVDRFKPRPSCVEGVTRLEIMASDHARAAPVLQTIPRFGLLSDAEIAGREVRNG